ncbi:MAG: hypothetical protein ABSE72_02520 [Bacteroidales bacterium]|jgi:ABC-type Mn2+/Zn2+ transport system permease subunit
MKKVSKYTLLFSLFAVFFISSCNKDNSSTQLLTRTSLTGTWIVNETKKKMTYEVIIVIDSTTSNGVLISNFAGAGHNVRANAYLSGNTLALTNNELLSNGWIVNGSGTVTGNTRIDWPYSLNDGANLTTIQAVFTKK